MNILFDTKLDRIDSNYINYNGFEIEISADTPLDSAPTPIFILNDLRDESEKPKCFYEIPENCSNLGQAISVINNIIEAEHLISISFECPLGIQYKIKNPFLGKIAIQKTESGYEVLDFKNNETIWKNNVGQEWVKNKLKSGMSLTEIKEQFLQNVFYPTMQDIVNSVRAGNSWAVQANLVEEANLIEPI
jgi:hypothetical protein